MKVRRLVVDGFRGISSLDWFVGESLVCLIGPGDSFKTTVLDSIEWALWPRWNLQVSDADFANCDPSEPIRIEVTVSPVPSSFEDDRSFGLDLRGWHEEEQVVYDEPVAGCEPAITVRLDVDASLEPRWSVINDRLGEEGRPIRAQDRERLGVVRLGARPEAHFSWGRGSGLTRLAESVSNAEELLSNVMREARSAVSDLEFEELSDALDLAHEAASSLGAGISDHELNVQLDPGASIGRASSLALHLGDVPVGASGSGTRRLLGLAIQSLAVQNGAIVLIDEIELGLEPHRLRHLIRVLREAASRSSETDGGLVAGQVFTTTHSPVAVCELVATEVHLVRPKDDGVRIMAAGEDLQDLVRGQPEALLGRSVVVCEGKTEVGLLRGLEPRWALVDARKPLAEKGVVLVDGGGVDKAALSALRMQELGYRCLFFADSDREPTPTVEELTAKGVEVVRWSGEMCTEQVIAAELPTAVLKIYLDYLVELQGDHVLQLLVEELGSGVDPYNLFNSPGESELRNALGTRANQHKWLKRIDWGEGVGRILGDRWDDLEGTDVAETLTEVGNWAYA